MRAGTLARPDVPTCGLRDSLAEVRKRVERDGWDTCVVVNEQRVVLGLLREDQLRKDAATVEEAMAPGPSTFRPHVAAAQLAEYLRRHDLASVPVTTGDGVLVGMFRLEDAPPAEHHHEHDDDG